MVHRPLLLALVCLGLLGPTQAADPEVSDSAAATTTTTTITLGADQKPSDPFRAIFDSLMQQRPKGQHGPPTTRDASRPNSQLLESLVAQLRPGGSNTIDLTKIELPDVNKALKGVVESAAQQLMGARADPSKDVFKAVGQKVNQFKNELESRVADNFGFSLPTTMLEKSASSANKEPSPEKEPARALGAAGGAIEPALSKLDLLRLLMELVDKLAAIALDDAPTVDPKLWKLLNKLKNCLLKFKST